MVVYYGVFKLYEEEGVGRKIERTSKENAKLKGEGSSRVTLKLAEDCLLFPERRPGFIFYEFHPTSSQASGVKRVKKLRGKQLHSQFRIAPEGKLIFCPFSSFSSGGKLGGNRREAILDCFVLLLHFCSGVCCQFAADPDFPLYLFRVSLQNSNSNSNFFCPVLYRALPSGKDLVGDGSKKKPDGCCPASNFNSNKVAALPPALCGGGGGAKADFCVRGLLFATAGVRDGIIL